MQVVDNSAEQYPNFFLQGWRVPVDPPGQKGPAAERVAALVVKQTVSPTGTVTGDNDVLLSDEMYTAPHLNEPAPIRLESDIAATKPVVDIVVVRDVVDLPEEQAPPPPVPPPFGDVSVRRSGDLSFGTAIVVPFGWQPRSVAPRVGLAGTDLQNFPGDPPLDLPVDYVNGFQNGRRNAVVDFLNPGDEVRFEESAGPSYLLTVPELPRLSIVADFVLTAPQPDLTMTVDTVVLALPETPAAGPPPPHEFLVTSRVAFEWSDEYELAILEIN